MFTVKTKVSKERVAALLECWSSYYSTWAANLQSDRAPKPGLYQDICFLARHALNGGAVSIQDNEGETHLFDRAAIEKGLNLMPTLTPHQWGVFLNEREDAETADQFLQLCLFGKLVYG